MRVLAAEQPHFAPKTYWWNRLFQSDVFVIMDTDYFNRRHWQNKTEILLAGKRYRLTIPIKHNGPSRLDEVHPIQQWRKNVIRTIHYAYAKSKYCEKIKTKFHDIVNKAYNNLLDLNMAFIQWGINAIDLEIRKKIVLDSNIEIKSKKTEYYIELCNKFDCQAILVGKPAVDSYLDMNALTKAEIQVRIQNWLSPPYEQYGVEKFEPNLSMLDTLFNMGELTPAIEGTKKDYILPN
jgi:hypothetical protein